LPPHTRVGNMRFSGPGINSCGACQLTMPQSFAPIQGERVPERAVQSVKRQSM